ncbi:hypothetical protein K8I31_17625 [bacterium]|nr:hypothetical protein [bacterium]
MSYSLDEFSTQDGRQGQERAKRACLPQAGSALDILFEFFTSFYAIPISPFKKWGKKIWLGAHFSFTQH